jgi:DNA repair exonuclease SbcCD nuclease subunit
MSDAFRFLHASDFHLEQPLYGVTEIPDDWKHLFVDAPLQAARKVFETAIKEEVDFVVLSGDLIDPERAGPRAISFLLDQLQLLYERKIAVYWTGGMVDQHDSWPAGLRFPENVQYYPPNHVEEITHMAGDRPLASVYGQSRSTRSEIRLGDYNHTDHVMFAIAVCNGRIEATSIARHRINYWALGGEHDRRTLSGLAATAHYPGSPQGRCPEEQGPHGCTIVHVEDDGRIRLRFVPTDVVRWQREKIIASASASLGEIERVLFDRAKKLISEAENRPQLVTFYVDGVDRWTVAARKPGTPQRMAEKLREEFARSKPPLWTLGVEFIRNEEQANSWFEEDTIRGDFLRALRDAHGDVNFALPLETYLPDARFGELLEQDVSLADSVIRHAVLSEAAVLGVELLSAGDAGPVDRVAAGVVMERVANERRKESRA